jgi:dihydrofolate reductase
MPKLCFQIAISLDGFVAGPNQSVENPLGVGGMRLFDWMFPLASWRKMAGLEGGEVNESSKLMEEFHSRMGATIMGRNMFGGHPGPWNPNQPWNGWWGNNPPFHHPVFVLTHYPREPLTLEGGTTFTFVIDGLGSAVEQAKRAAGGKDVWLGGGAKAAQQYFRSGLVDEMELQLVPILLGGGERLFDGVGDNLNGLKLVRTVAAANVTHLKFARQ